jgi:hypothetical protein
MTSRRSFHCRQASARDTAVAKKDQALLRSAWSPSRSAKRLRLTGGRQCRVVASTMQSSSAASESIEGGLRGSPLAIASRLPRAKSDVGASCAFMRRGTRGEQFLQKEQPHSPWSAAENGRRAVRAMVEGATPSKSAGVDTSQATVPPGDGERSVIGPCEVPGVEPRHVAPSWPSISLSSVAMRLALVAVPAGGGGELGVISTSRASWVPARR